MPVQARQGSTILLRIGDGPRFLGLQQAAKGESPRISALGFGLPDFSVDSAMRALTGHGIITAPPTAAAPKPRHALIRTRREGEGGSPNGSTRELLVADPSGVILHLHHISYCGGSGVLGNVCTTTARSPKPGIIALRDTNHVTIEISDPNTAAWYRQVFGLTPLVYQAATPAWQVGNGVHFMMFIGDGGPIRADAIDHACMSMDNFDPQQVTRLLIDYGLTQQDEEDRTPLVTYILRRMPNRGGAEQGTPELYLTDPDGLAIQLQDVRYCGGSGVLGDICPPLTQ